MGSDGGRGRGEFFDGHGFAGERRLVDEEILGRDQSHIGGNHVAGREAHNIAGRQFLEGNFDEGIAADRSPHGSVGAHHGAQLRGGRIGAMLLHEGEQHAQHDDG